MVFADRIQLSGRGLPSVRAGKDDTPRAELAGRRRCLAAGSRRAEVALIRARTGISVPASRALSTPCDRDLSGSQQGRGFGGRNVFPRRKSARVCQGPAPHYALLPAPAVAITAHARVFRSEELPRCVPDLAPRLGRPARAFLAEPPAESDASYSMEAPYAAFRWRFIILKLVPAAHVQTHVDHCACVKAVPGPAAYYRPSPSRLSGPCAPNQRRKEAKSRNR